MSSQSAINKDVFIPCNERMLVAVEVRRRKKKRMSFLSPVSKGDYATFICVSVTNTRPHQLIISKVKRFSGTSTFTRTSQWVVEQLRQVNGINPNKDSPEFDLVFVNTVDQWVASSAAEKCILVQILYRACQTYWEGKAGSLVKTNRQGPHQVAEAGPSDSSPLSRTQQARRKSFVVPRLPEFINCPSKLTGDASTMNLFIYRCKAFFNHLKNSIIAQQRRSLSKAGQAEARAAGGAVGNVVHRMNVALGERGDRLTPAEDKTLGLVHAAHQLADNAHKRALKYAK
ncbi:syntaxin binding protein 6 (amisyn), like isoform X1 [Dunckerocampus dactyliophorus]|uniref:syntaxin binding protein 6 (amisyn), like isoform X1 n=1 Tax=Dunckerocampus dactyliophorus TaxID=161453 RepID=UPI0024054651|nr:syntaxin binding protein 6 (amisyn), like isoform X1 [Dunckerocampus dactyliophorus]